MAAVDDIDVARGIHCDAGWAIEARKGNTVGALVDLVIPRVDEPHLGVSIPAGAVIPEPLRPAVEAMTTPRKRRSG